MMMITLLEFDLPSDRVRNALFLVILMTFNHSRKEIGPDVTFFSFTSDSDDQDDDVDA